MSPAVDCRSDEARIQHSPAYLESGYSHFRCPLPSRKLAHATALEMFRNSLETTQTFQIGWESLSNRRRNIMGSHGNGSTVARLTWDRCDEEDAAVWKVLLMISALCELVVVGYAMRIRGSVLNRYGKTLVQRGRKSITKGKELLAEGRRLWEKGQGLRIEGIYLTREVENLLDYECGIMDEARDMVFKAESVIDDGVKMMEDGHSLELAGEDVLRRGRALKDKGECMIEEGERLIDLGRSILM